MSFHPRNTPLGEAYSLETVEDYSRLFQRQQRIAILICPVSAKFARPTVKACASDVPRYTLRYRLLTNVEELVREIWNVTRDRLRPLGEIRNGREIGNAGIVPKAREVQTRVSKACPVLA